MEQEIVPGYPNKGLRGPSYLVSSWEFLQVTSTKETDCRAESWR